MLYESSRVFNPQQITSVQSLTGTAYTPSPEIYQVSGQHWERVSCGAWGGTRKLGDSVRVFEVNMKLPPSYITFPPLNTNADGRVILQVHVIQCVQLGMVLSTSQSWVWFPRGKWTAYTFLGASSIFLRVPVSLHASIHVDLCWLGSVSLISNVQNSLYH